MPRPKRDQIAIVLDLQAAYNRAYSALDDYGRRVVDEVTKRQTPVPQPAKVQRTRRKTHLQPADEPQPTGDLAGAAKAYMDGKVERQRRLGELTNELNERAGREPGRALTRTLLDRLYDREDLRPLIDELRTLYPKWQAKEPQPCA